MDNFADWTTYIVRTYEANLAGLGKGGEKKKKKKRKKEKKKKKKRDFFP